MIGVHENVSMSFIAIQICQPTYLLRFIIIQSVLKGLALQQNLTKSAYVSLNVMGVRAEGELGMTSCSSPLKFYCVICSYYGKLKVTGTVSLR